MPSRFQNFARNTGKFAKKKKKREKNLSIPLSKNRPVTGAMFLFCYFSFGSQDFETVQHCLDLQNNYASVGLFGFSLPPAVFSVLEKKAAEANCNCSELLQKILEDAFPQEIANELHNSHSPAGQTNLITSKSYGVLHNRSREQIKQYFGQKNRVLGAAKIGRDWVLPKDATFPTDQRRKVPK